MNKNVIDLYAGVGGLSLGVARAGFTVAAAVELDPLANATHALNFPKTRHIQRDVSRLSGAELLQFAELKRGELAGLVGGPPCQGFSEIGRRTARDPRNQLLAHFFRLVAETQPAFYVAENVPGLLDHKHASVLRDALRFVPDAYVRLEPLVVKANEHGAPTSRTRVFFIGFDPRRVNAFTAASFAPAADCDDVRVRDALKGLPAIRSSWLDESQGWRAIRRSRDTAYEEGLFDRVPKRVGDASSIAMLRAHGLVSGFLGTVHTEETVERFRALRFGERDPVSKAARLDPSGYCPTIRAGTGFDRGRYQAVRPIHPNSPRVIAPREAARLQGFPDWFQFHATKWHAFRQIGNSVSPIVAESLLTKIADSIG